jgi:hypothetical protein
MAKEAQIVTRQAQTGQEIGSRIYAPVLEQKCESADTPVSGKQRAKT